VCSETDVTRIVFQDEELCAIHKPAGIPFHSTDEESGVVQQAKSLLGNESIFPVHRLDKMTSGLILFAKNKKSNSELSQLFAEKKIEKYYLALSLSKPKKKQGAVIGDMKKGRRGSYLLLKEKNNPSITRFFTSKVSLHTGENNTERKAWLFVLKPETGKTHQLRVALKSLGSAVFGDQRYGKGEADRGYLHAYKVRFELNNKLYEICDPEFAGASFRLSSTDTTDDQDLFIHPEKLNWPKGAFRLTD